MPSSNQPATMGSVSPAKTDKEEESASWQIVPDDDSVSSGAASQRSVVSAPPGEIRDDSWEVCSAVSAVQSIPSDVLSVVTATRTSFTRIDEFPKRTSRPHGSSKNRGGPFRQGNQQEKETQPEEDNWSWQATTEKPMSDKLRRKHEKSGRRRFLKGHTGRFNPWAHYDKELSEQTLEREHRCSFKCVCSLARRPEEERLTALDLALNKSGVGYQPITTLHLNKGKAWERIPAILEQEALNSPSWSNENNRRRPFAAYTLPVLSVQLTKSGAAALQLTKSGAAALQEAEQRDRTIYYKPAGPHWYLSTKVKPRKVFAKISLDPPINGVVPLAWTIPRGQSNPKKRGEPTIYGGAAWLVEDAPLMKGDSGHQQCMEVDLGKMCDVAAISTQGGPPPIRMYPLWSDLLYPPGTTYETQVKLYKGPTWEVRDEAHLEKLQWVKKYKVLWRADGGRHWNLLGLFQGNRDATTEIAHCLPGGVLTCRYLRIVPLDCENGGALRIGVYGPDNNADKDRPRSQRRAHVEATDLEDDTVEYRLHHPSIHMAPNADRRENGTVIRCFSHEKDANRRKNRIAVKKSAQSIKEEDL